MIFNSRFFCPFQLDSNQFELMESILHHDGSIVLANNERIVISDTLRFIWEVRTKQYFLALCVNISSLHVGIAHEFLSLPVP